MGAELTEAIVASSVIKPTFEQVYAESLPWLVRLARVALYDSSRAEEVVQDAFATLYGRYARIDTPSAYLRVTVLNGCRSANRRRAVAWRHRMVATDSVDDEPDHLLDAVRRLPTRRRDVILLRYYLDLTEAETAATLGIPIGTVKSTTHRALRNLKEAIE